MDRTCTKCSATLPLSEFYVDKRKLGMPGGAHYSACRKCHLALCDANPRRTTPEQVERRRAGMRARYHRNRDVNAAKRRTRYHELRAQVLAAYGGECACCGENEPEYLCVDHVNGDGSEHRKIVGIGGLYWWLRMNGFPRDGFQLLCYNCNKAKGSGAECPHRSRVRAFTDALLNYGQGNHARRL